MGKARGSASTARVVACRLLGEQRRRSARARELLRSSNEFNELSAQDQSLATRLVLGVVATSGQLDQALSSYTHKLEPRVRDALRVSTFELLYLQTPPAVVVSQGVELVAQASPRARGMANAVLRRVAQNDAPRAYQARAALATSADVSTLALASGLPAWLLEKVRGARGDAAARAYATSSLEPAPVWASAIQDDEALNTLSSIPELLPGVWRIAHAGELGRSGALESVAVAVADYAARQVCHIAAPVPGSTMLEVGQGRGTKTLLLLKAAHEQGNGAHIVAVDNVASKVRVSSARLNRAFPEEVLSLVFDATQLGESDLPDALSQSFSSVFVDAPCSGTGTLRRHPEIAWALDPAAVDPTNPESLPGLQLGMLTAASARVAPGGTLTYSTCSVLHEENEQVVKAFLSSDAGREFCVAPIADAPGVTSLSFAAREELLQHVEKSGFFQTCPQLNGSDGHFCARLVRAH